MNQPIHNAYWLSRFESILNSALVQHRAPIVCCCGARLPRHFHVVLFLSAS